MTNNNSDSPSANPGRTGSGRFAVGNPGGPGNPHAGKVSRLRSAMLQAVTRSDMRAVTRKLVEMAMGGDLKAIELLLTRTLGKADGLPAVAIQVNRNAPESSVQGTLQIDLRRQEVAQSIARLH